MITVIFLMFVVIIAVMAYRAGWRAGWRVGLVQGVEGAEEIFREKQTERAVNV